MFCVIFSHSELSFQIYGRLKGVPRGRALDLDVEALMNATSLSQYADRLASKLSGGNQRKLALAIAMMGLNLFPL